MEDTVFGCSDPARSMWLLPALTLFSRWLARPDAWFGLCSYRITGVLPSRPNNRQPELDCNGHEEPARCSLCAELALGVLVESTRRGGLQIVAQGFNPGLSNVSLQLLSEWNESTEPRFAQVKPTPD